MQLLIDTWKRDKMTTVTTVDDIVCTDTEVENYAVSETIAVDVAIGVTTDVSFNDYVNTITVAGAMDIIV